MTDASERKRLIAKLRTIENWTDHRTNVCYDASDMLRADAETIHEYAVLCAEGFSPVAIREIESLRTQLAAQSAELERVRKDAERYRWWRDTQIHYGPYAMSVTMGKHRTVADFDAAIDAALAAPPAAGGEKEG